MKINKYRKNLTKYILKNLKDSIHESFDTIPQS